ncbi:putative damage-inducible protein DinB [Arthrobacter pigmenti]|uniref:Putative damage-inducible protein DinB n=1 Tax=Arthrobacter pigmenti TaxID=271432 RepID=A0A846RTH5_9MICC|nr:DUF664 domain-containing protein [Arthrobacter pigmenti]NJC23804.1 putative damage-inducible protein DinB [Arthrobacter pigmenti]
MSGSEVLEEAFGRISDAVAQALDGLGAGQLAYRPTLPEGSGQAGNSVGWLIWHLIRVQDNHLADAAERNELWLTEGWAERFDLDLPREDTGYGHTSNDVDKVRVESSRQLVEYHSAVHARSMEFIRGLNETDLNRIVDASWDPPVTMRVRLVSVVEDCLQHAGQAAYLRGLLL